MPSANPWGDPSSQNQQAPLEAQCQQTHQAQAQFDERYRALEVLNHFARVESYSRFKNDTRSELTKEEKAAWEQKWMEHRRIAASDPGSYMRMQKTAWNDAERQREIPTLLKSSVPRTHSAVPLARRAMENASMRRMDDKDQPRSRGVHNHQRDRRDPRQSHV